MTESEQMSNVSLQTKALALIECGEVSLRTKMLALIECGGQIDCKGCTWDGDDEVCTVIPKRKCLMSDARKILYEMLDEYDRLKEENAVLKERIAIMEVEREDDLK